MHASSPRARCLHNPPSVVHALPIILSVRLALLCAMSNATTLTIDNLRLDYSAALLSSASYGV
jgi:hypothetical protein